jgi:hypothetical protein
VRKYGKKTINKSRKEVYNRSSLSEGMGPTDTLILDFQSPELDYKKIKFCI